MSTVPDGNATSSITVSVVLCGCGEGGECIQVDMPNFGIGSYYQEQCMCAPAYEGKLCENDIDGCREDPCQNPSLCEDIPAPGVGFNCTGCLEGYQLSRNMCDGMYIVPKVVLAYELYTFDSQYSPCMSHLYMNIFTHGICTIIIASCMQQFHNFCNSLCIIL